MLWAAKNLKFSQRNTNEYKNLPKKPNYINKRPYVAHGLGLNSVYRGYLLVALKPYCIYLRGRGELICPQSVGGADPGQG